MLGTNDTATKSQSLFGAGVMMLVAALIAGVAAGLAVKTPTLDGEGDFGIVQFSIFAGAGLVAFAICYATSVLTQITKE
jgi:hypothetical protein